MGSSAGYMDARKARRSRVHESVQGSSSQPEYARELCGDFRAQLDSLILRRLCSVFFEEIMDRCLVHFCA
jgi:hypothetical protein